MPARGAPEWIVPVFASGIIVSTLVGLVAPVFTDVEFGDGVVRWLFPAALGLVAIMSPVQLRFFVLPRFLAAAESENAPGQSIEQIETSATVLVGAFAVSDAIYGAVTSIMLDNSLWALPFGAAALLSFATLLPWARGHIDERRRAHVLGSDSAP